MMSHLLAIETATDVCSVAVASQEDQIVAEFTMDRPRKHAEQLALMSQDALRVAGLRPKDLDAVAVSMGPGSYTGLRIGVSSAKAIAMASSSRLIGVPTLEALAYSVCSFAASGHLVLALQDARRDEVYAWFGRITGDGTMDEIAASHASITTDLPSLFDGVEGDHCWTLGSGAEKSLRTLQQHAEIGISPLSEHFPIPSARWVAMHALRRWHNDDFDNLAEFEPYYLKEYTVKRQSSSIFDRLPSRQ